MSTAVNVMQVGIENIDKAIESTRKTRSKTDGEKERERSRVRERKRQSENVRKMLAIYVCLNFEM